MYQALGERMKLNYEKAFNFYLPYRMPVIIRLDGKNFHTFTKKMPRPFAEEFITSMKGLTEYLCANVSTAVFAYSQSDEISLLLHPYKKLDSEPYFANEIQKIASITASMASAYFTNIYGKMVLFDARCFVLPEDEVVNYFIWRQQDATRNSIRMLAQSKFSHKELMNKNTKVMQEMMWQKDKTNWNNLEPYKKRGFTCAKFLETQYLPTGKKTLEGITIPPPKPHFDWAVDDNCPIFSEEREYISKWLKVEEE